VGETWREDPANDVGDDESIAATVNLARTVREAFASINARRPSTESGGAAAQASYVVSFGTEVLRLRAELARVTAERDALRAIIEGRTTPPTDAEIAAHWRAGGAWRALGLRGFALSKDTADRGEATILAALDRRSTVPRRWWPLDASGRPCAWPEVTP